MVPQFWNHTDTCLTRLAFSWSQILCIVALALEEKATDDK